MAKNDRTILVTGATGHQGGAAMRHLHAKGFTVRALTRDPSGDKARRLVGHGTEVVGGDLDDKASIARALEGVYGVFSVQVSSQGAEKEIRQGIDLADEAKRRDVRHFVYTSVASAGQNTGIPHFDSKYRVEEHLRGTGMRYTILRPAFFMENWLGMRGQIDAGTLSFPLAPDTRLQQVAVDDIGAFAAMAFEKPGHWQGRVVELAGDEPTIQEVTEALGRMAGREVRYNRVPMEEFEKQVGPDHGKMFRWFQEVGYQVDLPNLRREYSNLTSFERWLQTTWPKRMTA